MCLLEVGYSEDIGLRRIFVGEVTNAWTHMQSRDRVTELELSDGQKAIRDCVVSLSYADNVSRKKVIDDVAAQMGLLVHYAEGLTFTTFANGFSFIGAGEPALIKPALVQIYPGRYKTMYCKSLLKEKAPKLKQ